jgi:hypothetical protein
MKNLMLKTNKLRTDSSEKGDENKTYIPEHLSVLGQQFVQASLFPSILDSFPKTSQMPIVFEGFL